ncbi:MAG: sigma-70 family RNA polymerase sigma factor [Planctomycetes bacterium]|nr:sigma-70 family RNA polymerase sigma factor [Planctomycetota bacterium]
MDDTSLGGPNVRFQPTPWTMVLRGDAQALEHLARLYWKPVYFYVRRRGCDIETAKDLTQEFWATILERASLDQADPSRGRFRTFLLATLSNFLADEARAAGRQKRGGERRVFSMDFHEGETQLRLEPAVDDPPEAAFNRRWARALLQQAVEELKPPYLDAVKLHLASEKEIATKLGVSESDAKNTVHRGRAQLREILVAKIRQTVDDPDQMEQEIAEFLKAIR